MKFLSDESCDQNVVRALRAAGHDVLDVSAIAPTVEDGVVMALAHDEARILLTEDRDFGQLVYAYGGQTAGIVYMRVKGPERRSLGARIVAVVENLGEGLPGAFVTVTPGRLRVRRPERR